MPGRLPKFDKECFFISPIGDDGSETRRRADGVLDAIVIPAAEAVGLTAVRADRIGEGGQVNLQVIEHVCRSATAIADLTSANLNVYYEVGMRHTTRLPLVLIADEAERDKLPFDILVQRTIFFSNDMNGVATCKAQVHEQLQAALEGAIDSPLDAAVNIRQFEQGDAVERTLAELVTSVDGLSREVSRGGERNLNPRAIADLSRGLAEFEALAADRSDKELLALCGQFSRPIEYIVDQSRLGERELDVLRHRRLLARHARGLERPGGSAESADKKPVEPSIRKKPTARPSKVTSRRMPKDSADDA
jgi:hypothetical protein